MGSAAALALAGLLAFTLLAGATSADWSAGQVQNSVNSTRAGNLDFVHDYPSSPNTCQLTGPVASTTCSGSIGATTAASTTAATKNDTITDNSAAPAGTAMYSQGRVLSCAPVQFANAKDATNPLLPRYTVGFAASDPWSGTNAAQFDGTQSYAGAVKSESSIPSSILSLGGTAGYGAWFKTSTTAGGPILAFDTAPASAGGTRDKVLYMNTTGKLGFVFDTGSSTTGLSATAFNNGAWHFAYARLSIASLLGIPLSSTATLYVDGTQVAQSSSLIGSSGSGYLHVGWAPISGTTYGSGLSNYFNGTISNAVAFLGGSAPAVPPSNPASQAAFDTFASTATHQLRLGDSGTTTFGSAIGYVTGGDPCAHDTLAWTLGGASVFAATTLKTLATSGWLPATALAAPTPGNTQTSTTSFARAGTYDADVAGLHLYAPLSYRVGLVSPPATGWSLTFTWSGDPGAAFIA
ncbi:MAG: hypothetical protein WC642_12380 [Nocardioides sp.]